MDYSKTVNLPQTAFPMKASLVSREPEIQAGWEKMGLYELIRQQAAGKPKFVLHDGPPYANGDVHMGTAFNKISKDIIIKYKSMQGFDAPYVPGWDCHGMPIEHKVVAQLPEEKAANRLVVRKACRSYAEKFVAHQKAQFKRLGVLGDWNDPYLTMNKAYQAAIVRLFGQLAGKGFIYRGLKPVHWCTECQSALAEAEVEYADHTSPSITVRFQVVEGWAQGLGEKPSGPIYIPIWTTTPWTLPANEAIAVHPDLDYALVASEGAYYILADALVEPNWAMLEKPFERLGKVKGQALPGLRCQHPFLDRIVPVITAAHVTVDNGTGCVHTAPGHGQEDFVAGKQFGLEVFNPVGPDGRFTAQFPLMQGQFVFEANEPIIRLLEEKQALMAKAKLQHAYPHCWRHHTPIIFRATEQWFMNVDKDHFRQRLLQAIENEIRWIPEISRNRIAAMVESRPDWCLSRQRAWGVPVPIVYCTACGEPVMEENVFRAIEDVVAKESADAWFEKAVEDLVPQGTACSHCQGTTFRKETDILDVWFDSSASHTAVVAKRPDLHFPADLYLEGSDQHRGWFQVSLLTAMASLEQAPYRAVLTHGYIVDGEGKKMSKSLGNFISSTEAIARYGGADILRLWVASENIQNDVRASDEIFKRMVDSYRRIRNSLRFLLGNLHGFNPAKGIAREQMIPMDQYMLHRLALFAEQMQSSYESYEFHKLFQVLQNFCATDLSAFYFDVCKDRLYADDHESFSRQSAQTVLWHILNHVLRTIAPILIHTAEEAWQELRAQGLVDAAEDRLSVHLLSWRHCPEAWKDQALEQQWQGLFELRTEVMKQLEAARLQKRIRHSYEAAVTIKTRGAKAALSAAHHDLLPAFLVVSEVMLEEAGATAPELTITVTPASGKKCERCWRVLKSVGQRQDHPQLCPRCADVVANSLSSDAAPAERG